MNLDAMIGLIVGGLLGFCSSFFLSLIAFVFQIYHNSQQRQWDFEKQQREERKKVIVERLDSLDTLIYQMMASMQSASNALESLFFRDPDPAILRDYRSLYIIPILKDKLILMTSLFYFKDDELVDAGVAAFSLVGQYADIYDNLIESVESKDSDALIKNKEILSELGIQFTERFQYLLVRRDIVNDP